MARGKKFGIELGIGTFVNEQGGYTSVSVALALLLSLTLTFSLTGATWVQNRSADTQSVADGAALAGSNVVGSYMTLATMIDACVLTMGIGSAVTLGAGLIVSAIPGLSGAGAETISAAVKIFNARQKFATSASEGLQKLEATLPLMIAARSAAVVSANSTDSASYIGCAIPYPFTSESDFSSLDASIDTGEIETVAEQLQEKSDEAKELQKERDAALREGWLADCGDSPMNAYERAGRLANLGANSASYPYCASPDTWNFGYALARAKAYYKKRVATESPSNYSSEKLKADSIVRSYFYEYALSIVEKGYYRDNLDGTVSMDLPGLPYNMAMLKNTPLYTEKVYPYSNNGSTQIHGTEACAKKHGGIAGYMTLQAWDACAQNTCDECEFSTMSMANVSSASTNINNGFEHYWKRICEAAQNYQQASDALAGVNDVLRQLAQEGADLFNGVLDVLAAPRPKLCPPGAYGCVAAVYRAGSLEVPDGLSSAFTGELSVGAGGAVSAAALAPDENSDSNNVLTSLFDAISFELTGTEAGVLGDFGELWSGILNAYGGFYDGVASAVDGALGKIDGIPGSSAASWLCAKVGDMVRAAGFEPGDLRLLKPVLTNSQNVLDKAGSNTVGEARQFVELLGQAGDAKTFARTLGLELQNQLEGKTFTLAEIPIPGTDSSFPITVDIGELMGEVIS